MSDKKVIGIAGMIFLLCLVVAFAHRCFYTLPYGYSAIHLRLGALHNTTDTAGMYFRNPFMDNVICVDRRIQKIVIETTALSKDLQSVSIGVALNYQILDPVGLYKTIGIHFEEVILNPYCQESIKAIVAKFTAEDLIMCRHMAKDMVTNDLVKRLKPLFITLIDCNFIHSDFHREFMEAVESKQIAEQLSKRSKNLTEKVREEAIQARMKADADAYALKVKREQGTEEQVQIKKADAILKAIEKWNGQLPKIVTSSALLQLPTE